MNWRGIFKFPRTVSVMAFIVLAGLNTFLSYSEVDISPITVSSSSPIARDAKVVPRDVAVIEGLQLAETLSRPLFSPTRREFVPEPKPVTRTVIEPAIAAQNAERVVPPKIVFQGTRVIGQERRALVKVEGAERADWLPVGAQVSDWIIADIGDNNVRLSRGDRSSSYVLFGNEGKKQDDSAQRSATSLP